MSLLIIAPDEVIFAGGKKRCGRVSRFDDGFLADGAAAGKSCQSRQRNCACKSRGFRFGAALHKFAGQFSGVLDGIGRNWELEAYQSGRERLASVFAFFGDLTGSPAFVFCELQGVLIQEFGDLILRVETPGESIRDLVVSIKPGGQN